MKKLLTLATLVMAAASAQASYLYWQVSSDVVTEYSANYAMVKDSDGNSYSIYYGNAWGTGDNADKLGLSMNGQAAIEMPSADNGLSYYIELFQYDTSTAESTSVAISETVSYSSLASGGFITSSLSQIPSVWTGGSFTATPEPTSAMLLTIGFALLSLKRRKA